MTIRKRKTWIAVAAVALAGAGIASTAMGADETATPTTTTTTTTTASTGQTTVGNRVAAPFSYFAGSPENAVALANALRNGTTATLTFAPTSDANDSQPTAADITVPTKPMGWGNVSHALALAQFSLHQAGIDQPTAAELQAALDGGTVTNANGQTTTLTGVLQQRASGMGWGQVAQSYGTTMGAVNRGIRTSFATAAAPTSSSVSTGTTSAATTASSRGVTTAAGSTTMRSTGVVTASGSTPGQGHAYGRGIVTAGGAAPSSAATTTRGASAGITTGNGAAGSVANAGSGNGGAHGGGNGNGKGKGGS